MTAITAITATLELVPFSLGWNDGYHAIKWNPTYSSPEYISGYITGWLSQGE